MILEFIHLGQYSASHPQKGKILKPEQLWPKLNRKSFTEIFIEKSNEIFKNNENKFIALKYNSLAIDAWSIQGVHYLEIVLVNGLLNLPPLLMASFSNFLDTTNTYKEAIQSILLSLSSKKIVIGCCVSDNLRRQVAAISGGSQQSLQNDYDFQKIFEGAQALQHVRCACHTLQLAITDAIHENTDFAEIRDRVEKLWQLFHDDQIAQALGTKSPTFSTTRWNSLFIVILWFSTHSEKIIDLLTNNIRVSQLIMDKLAEHKKEIIQFLMNDLIIICISLVSFYRTTENLESDNLSIGYVYSIISMAIYKSQQIINSLQIETAQKFIDCLSRNISQRFFEYSPDNIIILVHSLTPFGRNQFRRTIDYSSLGDEVSYLDSEIEQPSFTFSPLLIEAFENILKLYYSGEIQISILENKATEQNNSIYILK